uniref:T-cell surface glycoprotein CD3 zeta chain n=1 Tax=Ogcocephalus cubifrons TaxID=2998064 RepID=A0A9Y2DXW7_9TELE|nr:cd3 zeta [Ogcocephalus cubifrons]
MALQMTMPGLLVLVSLWTPAEAVRLYDPEMCFILDGFLGLYGLIITGMFIKEKFFKPKGKATEEPIYSDLKGQETGAYDLLTGADPERGRNRKMMEEEYHYTGLTRRTEGEYKELPVKRERQRKNEQVYQGLSSATKDTYDSLQMKSLPAR